MLKIRSSSVGYLMTNPRGKSNLEKYNEALIKLASKQKRLDGLGPKAEVSRNKLTNIEIPAIEQLIKQLEPVKDEVILSETAKELIVRTYWENEHGIKKEFTSKYFDKGNDAEDVSIELAQRVNGWDAQAHNNKGYKNEYITGTPDLVYKELIPDIKTSWTALSFPLFEKELPNELYYWQIQSYLALTGREMGVVSYCLVDTPELLVMDEIYKYARINGLIETPAEAELEIRHAHNYSRLPEAMRVKNFYIERDESAIQKIYERVEKARLFYNDLLSLDNWRNVYRLKSVD